ncbi:hypothetical protein C3B79_3090 [Aeromonas hydrophila]|nr:hypothetical protein C3B79_3090 [Aeromonas hydrophila]
MPFIFYFPDSACSTSNTSGSWLLSGALLLAVIFIYYFVIKSSAGELKINHH